MIKVSVMYPNTPGAKFNARVLQGQAHASVKKRMGNGCKFYTVDKGLAGGAPGDPATYLAMCHIYCDSVETFQSSFGPHAQEIMASIANYTDLAPVIQISEVVVGQRAPPERRRTAEYQGGGVHATIRPLAADSS